MSKRESAELIVGKGTEEMLEECKYGEGHFKRRANDYAQAGGKSVMHVDSLVYMSYRFVLAGWLGCLIVLTDD